MADSVASRSITEAALSMSYSSIDSMLIKDRGSPSIDREDKEHFFLACLIRFCMYELPYHCSGERNLAVSFFDRRWSQRVFVFYGGTLRPHD